MFTNMYNLYIHLEIAQVLINEIPPEIFEILTFI